MHPSDDPRSGRLARLFDTNHGTWRGMVRMALSQISWLLGRAARCEPQQLERTRRLVFVCLGNINRSAFAHVVAEQQGLPCISLGLSTTTGAPATESARRQAELMGYSLHAHRATDWKDYQFQVGDLLLAMEERHVGVLQRRGVPADAILLLGQWARPMRLHLHDPDTLSRTYFATCFTLIESAVRMLAQDWQRRGGRP